jgi:predicted SAM-dependent methyltransferase
MKAIKVFLIRALRWLGFPDYFIWLSLQELRLLRVRIFALLSWKQRAAIRRARKMTGLKVNLGCGQFASEVWIGIDGSFQSRADWYLDLRTGLPLAGQSCSYLFCEHFLEHLFYPDEVRQLLSECYRVLQDGGVLRVIVPDAEKFVRAYAAGNHAFLRSAAPDSSSPLEALNLAFHGLPLGEHHYAYDFDMIAGLLASAGFRQIVLSECRRGSIASALDRQDIPRVLESLYIEAIR